MIYPASFYKSKKLLLIEDCEPVRASIKGMLQQIGFEDITTVSDAVQAMPLAKQDNFDVILADFDLGPGKDALQFFTELSQQALLRLGCCFILMSAEPRRLPVLGVLQGAPDAFILKPFSYVELEKRLAKAWSIRSKLRKAHQALRDKDYTNAQLELDQLINAVNSASLPALRIMAEVLLQQGSYDAALKLYQQVIQQREFSWALLGRGVALLQQGDFVGAETQLLSLTEQDDCRPEALEWLACLYLRQQQFDSANQQLAELLRLQSNHFAAHRAKVALLLLQKQTDGAVKYLQKLILQYRFSGFDQADYYFELCRALLQQAQQASMATIAPLLKKAAEALASMPQKLQSDESDIEQSLLKARIQLLKGHIADAKQQFSQLLVPADTAKPALLLDYARLAFALGEVKEADSCLNRLKQYQGTIADLHGCCVRLTTQHALQQELALREQIARWNQQGMAQAQNGEAKAALLELRQAFLVMPCNASLVLNMLQALGQLPADKALLPLAQAALTALEFSTKTAANQQRLAQLLPQLPQLYLD
jgi:DNA-binding response OmpR family regulator